MHIADGIIPVQAAIAADAAAVGAVCLLSRRMAVRDIPKTALMTSALFLASLVHFPLAGASVHLGLFGLAGILLGRRAFPAVFIALMLQAVLFQHGGLLSLGLNTINMGLGALAGALVWRTPGTPSGVRAFAAGFAGIMVPASLMIGEFILAGYGKKLLFLAAVYGVLAALEGGLTASATAFLKKARPELLEGRE